MKKLEQKTVKLAEKNIFWEYNKNKISFERIYIGKYTSLKRKNYKKLFRSNERRQYDNSKAGSRKMGCYTKTRSGSL